MTRRDTIIVAVLLNAGLLIVLFATSMKSDPVNTEAQSLVVVPAVKQEAVEQPAIVENAPVVVAQSIPDEVEQKAQQYAPPILSNQPAPSPNFAADLQAIAAPALEQTPKEAVSEVEPSFKEFKVKKGDVLERIARQHHVTVDDILKANQMQSPRLKIGQVLKIPTQSSKAAKSAVVEASDSSTQYYTVKNGDNPWTIAVKHHMKVEELLKINNMNEEKARRLKPGDRIRIR